ARRSLSKFFLQRRQFGLGVRKLLVCRLMLSLHGSTLVPVACSFLGELSDLLFSGGWLLLDLLQPGLRLVSLCCCLADGLLGRIRLLLQRLQLLLRSGPLLGQLLELRASLCLLVARSILCGLWLSKIFLQRRQFGLGVRKL